MGGGGAEKTVKTVIWCIVKYFLTFYLIMIALPVGLTHARNESFPSRTSSTLLILFLVYARLVKTQSISIHKMKMRDGNEILEHTTDYMINYILQRKKIEMKRIEIYMYIRV